MGLHTLNATLSLFVGHPRTDGSAHSLFHKVYGNAKKSVAMQPQYPFTPTEVGDV